MYLRIASFSAWLIEVRDNRREYPLLNLTVDELNDNISFVSAFYI